MLNDDEDEEEEENDEMEQTEALSHLRDTFIEDTQDTKSETSPWQRYVGSVRGVRAWCSSVVFEREAREL
jgi:hypothetical protein